MRVELEDTVAGVDPERALSWWTDYREGQRDHTFVPGIERRVMEEQRAHVIEDRVEWLGLPVFTERVRAQQRGNTVKLLGENTWATFRARYTFEPTFDPEGTQVSLVADVDPRGPLSWISGATRPIVERILRWDTRHHLEEMREELVDPLAV